MADFTASTGLRDLIGTFLDGCYYWVTLHDATGGFLAGDTYTAGIRGELATVTNGYTRGAKTLDLTNTAGVLDGPDAVWANTSGSNLGPVSYAAVWGNSTNTITGAKLICVKDSSASPQTSSTGQNFTAGIANPITIPTPA